MKRLAFVLSLTLLLAACAGDDSGDGISLERTTSTVPQVTTTTSINGGGDGGTTSSTAQPSDAGTDSTPPTNGDESPTTTEPPSSGPDVAPCEAPEDLAVYCTPFTLDQGDTQIVWDRWFWGQGIFSKGTVEVFTNGQSVASGAFSGASSIMEQGDQGEFIFYDDAGDVVAIATQDEIAPAIIAILEAEGIGG